MLDSMPIACLFWNEDGIMIDCNEAVVKLFECGSKRECVENFTHFTPVYQSDGTKSAEKKMGCIRQAFDTGGSVFRWEHCTESGKLLPTEVHLLRVKWKDGYRVVGYIRDLRRIESVERDMLRVLSLVENSPQFVMYVNTSGDIEYMNETVLKTSGFSKEELLTRGLRLMFSEEDIFRLSEVCMPGGSENGGPFNFEMDITCKNEERRVLWVFAFSAVLHSGEPGVGITARDITDMKRMQGELIEARKRAEFYNKAKSDFLSRVSHEMKTPMNAVINMTNFARSARSEQERASCLDKIKSSSRHLLAIIDNIIDMSNIEAGKFSLLPGLFCLSDAISSVAEMIAPMAAEKKQKFTLDLDKNLPYRIVTDERRVKQALVNLLSNAVKFTPRDKGKIHLSVKLAECAGDSCVIAFEVSDNGVGIKTDRAEHIWGAFEQADNGMSRAHGGIGLGLSITRRIIRSMGGDIRVDSKPGRGSRFSFTIRAGQDGAVNSGKEEQAALSARSVLSGRRVLIVDDVEINREILSSLLEDTGALIDIAADGAEALRLFIQNGYELVLMDLHMPGMDGFEAARQIRRRSEFIAEGPSIIAVTADMSGDVPSRCIDAGMDNWLYKPVEYDALIRTIKQHMQDRFTKGIN
ncbi:hypothetical protein FACS1894167_03910 [Synergistales bacterium]|nr:hypothetical protein FACS1894167_03910 [Synergistales bacterium]